MPRTTPRHTYLFLTKRTQNLATYFDKGPESECVNRIYEAMGEIAQRHLPDECDATETWLGKNYLVPLRNCWFGMSAGNQATFDQRAPWMMKVPSVVRWLSYEPAIGPLMLHGERDGKVYRWLTDGHAQGFDWIVQGGQSGPGSRICELDWLRSMVAQCKDADVPCFTKQLGARPFGEWGENPPMYWLDRERVLSRHKNGVWKLRDRKGGDIEEFPSDLRVREMPSVEAAR